MNFWSINAKCCTTLYKGNYSELCVFTTPNQGNATKSIEELYNFYS